MTTTETLPPPAATTDESATTGLRWWVEVAITVAFYIVYSMIRNQFGSSLGRTTLQESLDNALRIIDLEQALGLYHEELIQRTFLEWDAFIVFWNVFYGSFHFAVTIFAMVYLFLRYPQRYMFMRSALAATTVVALIGFAYFPLMPPRLLTACRPVSEWGACLRNDHEYVDTLVDPGGLWSFENGPMEAISNQYAAMPSLHIGWALWCAIGLYPVFRNRWAKLAIAIYPALTLFAIVVTANHYWIDAIGGMMALAFGLLVARPLSRVFPGRDRFDRPEVGTIKSDG